MQQSSYPGDDCHDNVMLVQKLISILPDYVVLSRYTTQSCMVPRERKREREREIHYIFISHLRADQMFRGLFLGTTEISDVGTATPACCSDVGPLSASATQQLRNQSTLDSNASRGDESLSIQRDDLKLLSDTALPFYIPQDASAGTPSDMRRANRPSCSLPLDALDYRLESSQQTQKRYHHDTLSKARVFRSWPVAYAFVE